MIDFQEKMETQEKSWQEEEKPKNNRFKRSLRLFSYLLIFVVIGFFIFSSTALISSQSSQSWLSNMSFWGKIKHLATTSEKSLAGENEDRINVLLTGIGGAGHDGAQLTDTIILVSMKPSTQEVAMVSIPRDMSVPWPDHGWTKINNINAYGESNQEGTGLYELNNTLEKLFNIDIHYNIKIDFEGFVKIVDELGGLEVDVENTLDDYKYPISGQEDNSNYYSRYEHLHIEEGPQTMDGTLALKYARSRHAQGIEGSDFARAKRQQKIIEAIKDKVFSSHIYLKPGLISRIINHLDNNLETNFSISEIVKMWDLFKDTNSENINNYILNDAPDNYLHATRSTNGAYILVPKTGNYKKIADLIQDVFGDTENTHSEYSQKTFIEPEKPESEKEIKIDEDTKVEVLNGTNVNGLASETAENLENMNLIVTNIDNSPQANNNGTKIYDLSFGNKKNSLTILEEEFSASSSTILPKWLKDYISNRAQEEDIIKPDLIIILGAN
ncbi:LCP family protein [Patescibacteria group bacterium]|nr:LCP family protein [Patescibacteria group bacterium]